MFGEIILEFLILNTSFLVFPTLITCSEIKPETYSIAATSSTSFDILYNSFNFVKVNSSQESALENKSDTFIQSIDGSSIFKRVSFSSLKII